MPYLFVLMTLLALATQSWAQQLPEVALKDHATAFATTPSPETENYNFKIGNMTTDLVGAFSMEYNDNINETTTGSISDMILRFGIRSKSVLPLTELNSLTLNINADYRFYLDHSELNSNKNFLDINPGSELAFKWWIKNMEFKLYDQLQYNVTSTDTRVFNTNTSTVTGGNTSLGQLMNRAGLEGMWDFNDLKIYGGYSRDDVRADRFAFRALDRTAHNVYLSPLFLVHPDFSVGIMSSYTWNNYRYDFQNDSTAWALGPTFYWQASPNLNAALNVYWKSINSDTNGTSGDTSDTSKLNGSFRITHEMNSLFNHSIEIARATDFGTVTNATTITSIYYLPVYQLTENLALKGRFGDADGKDSDGPNAEQYVRRVFAVGTGYTINDKLTTDLTYSFVSQSSNVPERPFNQNRIIWEFNYDF